LGKNNTYLSDLHTDTLKLTTKVVVVIEVPKGYRLPQ